VDRHIESLERSARFSYRRLWVALLLSALIMAAASLLVRAFPNSGYQAGHDAVAARDQALILAGIQAAGGTALTVCDELHADTESSPTSPRYDYPSFIKGCGEAISNLAGRPVPLLPAGE
jgi:hypothetical protein